MTWYITWWLLIMWLLRGSSNVLHKHFSEFKTKIARFFKLYEAKTMLDNEMELNCHFAHYITAFWSCVATTNNVVGKNPWVITWLLYGTSFAIVWKLQNQNTIKNNNNNNMRLEFKNYEVVKLIWHFIT